MMEQEYVRPDGRKSQETRNIEIEAGVLERVDGSARVVFGKNIVLAAVNGPKEMHPKHASLGQKAVVRVTYRMLSFSVDYRKAPFPSRREKEISKVLSEAFESVVITELYPRSAIDIQVQMIQADGGSRTSAAIAVSTALADAGIPMRGLISGVASGLYEDICQLDLSGLEDNKGTGDMPILYSPSLDEVSLFQLDGKFTLDQVKTCFNYSIDAMQAIEDLQKAALVKRYAAIRDTIKETRPFVEEEEEDDDEDLSQYSDDAESVGSGSGRDDDRRGGNRRGGDRKGGDRRGGDRRNDRRGGDRRNDRRGGDRRDDRRSDDRRENSFEDRPSREEPAPGEKRQRYVRSETTEEYSDSATDSKNISEEDN